MFVELGNDKAIEGYRPDGSTDGEVQYRSLEGEQVTTIHFPDGTSVQEAFLATTESLRYHIEQGESPVWVHSDSPGLQTLLEENYGVNKKKPAKWGRFKAHETPGVLAAGVSEENAR
jgi:hypothetical protein